MTDALQSRLDWNDPAQSVTTRRRPSHSERPFGSTKDVALHGSDTSLCPSYQVPGLNLFRRNDEQDIICAVPEDCPVPSFLQDPAWSFAGRFGWKSVSLRGFDLRAARSACRGLGFYLFQTWGHSEMGSGRKIVGRN